MSYESHVGKDDQVSLGKNINIGGLPFCLSEDLDKIED